MYSIDPHNDVDTEEYLAEPDHIELPRIGILGGTFDPPHIGHLILAETAMDALGLEKVLFVPAAQPPHKLDRGVTSALHRYAMLQRALAGNPRFEISRADMDREGPHYTADMLSLIRAQYRGHDLFFLMGSDSLNDLATWRAPEWIIAQAILGVTRNPGTAINLDALAERIPGLKERVIFVDLPQINIRSTLLRAALQAGHSIRYQVPDAVLEYIQKQGLYRS
ncbi:MAG: nicotinate-nucleotide adenylyltransferase [Anaerolineae bacterium]